MENKRIAFIIPYFGKFNNYFDLFLKSCEFNKDIAHWIIFTDDRGQYNYPDNVTVNYTSFNDMKKKIQSKFDFNISLENPYKLCDYRASYGYIFEEELKGYDYWGYCDNDLIFGKLSNFITADLLNKEYDKLFVFGHCSLYKNDKKINRAFMLSYEDTVRYKEVFQTSQNCSFDEEFNSSINNIFNNYNIEIYKEQFQANIYTKHNYFKLTYWDFDKEKYLNKNFNHKLFIWNKGKLNMYYITKNGVLSSSEYMYIHLQSRPMKNSIESTSDLTSFKIVPNRFEMLEVNNITQNNYKMIKKRCFNLHYVKLRFKNLKVKIKRRFVKL